MRRESSTSKLGLAAVALSLAGGRLPAQVVKATLADSSTVANNVYRRMFDGIVLTEEQRNQALAAIRKEFVAQLNIKGEYPEVVPKVRQLLAQRDSVLRSLIRSSDDRKKFDERARTSRP